MRGDGLRRRNKPWPSAADLHFPLIDLNIRKSKPFWEAQAFGRDRLASFIALSPQPEPATTAAADYLDFELRQNSNFIPELSRAIDTMCVRGRGVLKVVVDPFNDYRLVAEAIDPVFVVMADLADDFPDADWFVHVQQVSVAQYRRDRRYNQDEDVIRQIRGNKDVDLTSGIAQDREAREGVTYSRSPNVVILWEHYVKTMAGWDVHTYSPVKPDLTIRRPFQMPYRTRAGPSVPFFSFKMETKEKGWYAPRGIAELCAPFESYACKLWNEKTDAMTLGNRPILTSEQQIPNTANIRWNPGEIVPGNLRPVAMPQPAFSFDQELAFTRSVSEQLTMLPDFGITVPGQASTTGGQARTATENNRIANLQSVGTESQGRLFRQDLARVYRHVWGLLLQFRRQDLTYWAAGQLQTLPEQALHDAYLILPEGSPNDWDKQQRLARAMARLQAFANHPLVDQEVLVRDALTADDPALALKAFLPSGAKGAQEAEDEAKEVQVLKDGFPAAVTPGEDHVTRIHVLLGWLQKQAQTGAPMDPVARQRVTEHLATHFTILQQLQPEAARQLLAAVKQLERQPQPAGPGPAPTQNPMAPSPELAPA